MTTGLNNREEILEHIDKILKTIQASRSTGISIKGGKNIILQNNQTYGFQDGIGLTDSENVVLNANYCVGPNANLEDLASILQQAKGELTSSNLDKSKLRKICASLNKGYEKVSPLIPIIATALSKFAE